MEIYSVPPFSTPVRYPGMSRETFFLRVPPRTLCSGVLFALDCCGLSSSQEPSQKSRALDSHIKNSARILLSNYVEANRLCDWRVEKESLNKEEPTSKANRNNLSWSSNFSLKIEILCHRIQISLANQLIFCNVTIGFPVNKHRNSILIRSGCCF